MSETIFSKIIRGEIPCHKLYEDEHVLSFLDIAPLSPGHALVIPKQFARTLDELDDVAAAALGAALVKVARAVKKVSGCSAYNVLQNNEAEAHQAVFHVHFHIIPKPDDERGLQIEWPSRTIGADAALWAQRVREWLAAGD
jgi:histidine triad (HIT) family protein